MQEYLRSESINRGGRKTEYEIWSFRGLLSVLFSNVYPLIRSNLCFLLFCIPVITIPSAISAQYKICIDIIRQKKTRIFRTYVETLKESFLNSIIVTVFLSVLIVLGLYGSWFYFGTREQSIFSSLLGLVTAGIALISFLMFPSAHLMLMITDLPVKLVLKNAMILTFLNCKYTILSGVISIALVLFQYVYFLRFWPLTITVGISLAVYLSAHLNLYGVQRYVLRDTIS